MSAAARTVARAARTVLTCATGSCSPVAFSPQASNSVERRARCIYTLSCWLGLVFFAACGGGIVAGKPVESAPAADPRAAGLYLDAVTLMASEDADTRARAERGFETALQADPQLWEAHYNWGLLLRRRGELRSAQEHLQRAHALAEAAGEPLLALAEVERALGQRDHAAELLELYVQEHPEAIAVRVALTAVQRELGAYDAALASARAALLREPANIPALLEIGRVYRVKGEWDVAEVVFHKVLSLDPRNALAHNDLGLVALARGDTQRAFDSFERATANDPRFAPARLNRASVLLRAGDYAAAQREYEAVLEIAPDNIDARIALGICLRGLNKPDAAEVEYQKALAASPNHAAALFDLAILRAEFQNRRSDAVPLFKRYLEVSADDDPSRKVAERYLTEIAAQAQQDSPPSAAAGDGT
jgi:tetratricopeptide (TPR) repeat protein